jgi:rhamnogalacturonyl hydrolase YesR
MIGRTLLVCAIALPALAPTLGTRSETEPLQKEDLLRESVQALVKMQEEAGQWPYEGVYKPGGKIPIGYRVGGTSIVATTLLHAAPQDKEARAAIAKALTFVLKELEDPLMAPSTKEGYDVRVWGHACALEFMCTLRAQQATEDRTKDVDIWIKKLVETLITEEIDGGGWNYASRRAQASFVTAPITQALLLANAQGEKVPAEIFQRARKVLEDARYDSGGFAYSGPAKGKDNGKVLPGSVARSAVCETTLVLLGGGDLERVQKAIDAFHTHWEELEKRRQKTGTHVPPYNVAPYYFYYGHRYIAQAIQMLPEKARADERDKLMNLVLKVRDKDGTWNDRVFERSRNYGTAMVALILLNDRAPLPASLAKK